jgi:hypothetical protein
VCFLEKPDVHVGKVGDLLFVELLEILLITLMGETQPVDVPQ